MKPVEVPKVFELTLMLGSGACPLLKFYCNCEVSVRKRLFSWPSPNDWLLCPYFMVICICTGRVLFPIFDLLIIPLASVA